MRDLSQIHGLAGRAFAFPQSRADWRRFELTPAQLAHYEEHGYVSGVRILTDQQVETLRAELIRLLNPQHPGHELFHEYHSNQSADPNTVLFHALGAWRIEHGFHDALWNPAFTVPASQLLGGAVRFWHDQLFCKPPKHGGVVAWDQDYSYWTRTKPLQHLTCWIGLDDSDETNGCLMYVPGSHRWDLLPITGLAGDMDAIRKVLTEEQWQKLQVPVPVRMRKGEGTFHHPLLVHGSRENFSDRPRRALVLNTFKDGTCSDSDLPPLQGVPPVPKDQPMRGQFFPLLLDPARL